MKSNKKWTDEAIASEIKRIQEVLEIDHMPTKNEIKQAANSFGLAVAIANSGGMKQWCEKLGIDRQEDIIKRASLFEKKAVQILKEKTNEDFDIAPFNYPYNLIHKKTGIKISIKISERKYHQRYRTTYTWGFGKISSPQPCDYFMLVCNNVKLVDKILIVPVFFLENMKYLTVGKNSKYDYFKDRYDIIMKEIDTRKLIRRNIAVSWMKKWGEKI